MSTVKSFEESLCWQEARALVKQIYTLTKKPVFKQDYGLRDQIQRAAVSVMSNIAEGLERGTGLELLHFLYIAKGSAGEVRCQLYVAVDQGYAANEEFQSLKSQSLKVSKLLYNFIESVKNSKFKGLKFKKEKKDNLKQELLEIIKQENPALYEQYYKGS